MPTFVFNSPEGKKYRINAPEGTTQAQAFEQLQKTLGTPAAQTQPTPPSAPNPAAQMPSMDPSEGMSAGEKLLVGAGAGLEKLYRGTRDLIQPDSTLTPQQLEERQKEREDRKVYEAHHPGGWATAGEIAAEGLATAPIGGVIGTAAKALPAAGRLAAVGGRFVNPGTAGRAAAEAATVAGLAAPGEDETRLGNMGQAAALGPLANAVTKYGVAGVKTGGKYLGRKAADVGEYLLSGTLGNRQATIGAVNALDRTVGREGIDAAAEAVRNPTPSMFPRTTAAMSGNRQLGSLEAGMMERPSGNQLMQHREDVARRAWQELQGATESGYAPTAGLANLNDDAAEAAIQAARNVRGSFMRNGVPTTTRSFGQIAGGTAVPDIQEAALRRTLAKNSPQLLDTELQAGGRLADELGPQEIYKASQAAGPSNIIPSRLGQTVNAALNVLPQWRWRGVAQSLIKGANEKEQKLIDQALLDPQKFLSMVETQRALGRPVTGWQATLRDAMLGGQARVVGAESAGE